MMRNILSDLSWTTHSIAWERSWPFRGDTYQGVNTSARWGIEGVQWWRSSDFLWPQLRANTTCSRFKKLSSPLCACGLVGDADHYVFRCPLTAEFHLMEPSDEHRKSWFKNLRYSGQAQSKLIQAFKLSNGICDRLTQV
ncbi:hypothetical protein AVEN_45405-1 [Araneus ventricosus]|uniref:Uncharacterized protein n=1 Tax=Araneus ventricosus TaxID=182803 RepID=A0A4Y2QS42_ARAVE|nr:hypothetical protein AVEN_45405-1 [Araneus ventricosus]